MVRLTRLMHRLMLASFSLGQLATAQAPASASLSGHVLSEEGRALRAGVTLSFAAARGYPAPPRRVLTGANGAFTFSKLPASKYVLCAQVAGSEPSPANSPYVDTCVWGSGQTLGHRRELGGDAVRPDVRGISKHIRMPDSDQLPHTAAGQQHCGGMSTA